MRIASPGVWVGDDALPNTTVDERAFRVGDGVDGGRT